MRTPFSDLMKSKIITIIFFLSTLFIPFLTHARSSGIVGYTGISAALTCSKNGCHTVGSTFSPTVELLKRGTSIQPSFALVGLSYQYTLIVRGAGVAAGFNLGATKGFLSSSQTDTRIESGELTHAEPQLLVNETAQWDISWTAPDTTGEVMLHVCANIVDLKKTNLGDNTSCQVFTLSVTSSDIEDVINPVPVIDPLDDIVIDALSFLTSFTLPQVTANDNIDGIIGAVANLSSPLPVGTHQIDWVATDASGNVSQQTQNLIIRPMTTLQTARALNRGTNYPLTVYLNGELDSAAYPINIPLLFSGTASNADYMVSSNSVTINSGYQGSVMLSINNAASGTIEVSLDASVNTKYILGHNVSQSLTILDQNTAPTVSINITQAALSSGGPSGNVMTTNGGNVTVMAVANDPENNTLSYNWSVGTDSKILDLIADVNMAQLDFDPSSLAEGIYSIKVSVQDNAIPNNATTVLESWIRVLSTLPSLTSIDTDADGVNDDVEGVFDRDNDGVADYLDSTNLDFILGVHYQRVLSHVVQGLPGNKLRIGKLARRINSNAVWLLTSEVLSATSDSTLIPVDMLGIYDIEVLVVPNNIDPITISLPVLDILTSSRNVNIFSQQNGWQAFTADTNNYFEYANSIDGLCPAYGTNYTSTGQDNLPCIAITVKDGGPNDIDGAIDGIIRLRIGSGGSLAANTAPPLIVTPDSGGGNVFLLLFLLIIASVYKYKHNFMCIPVANK